MSDTAISLVITKRYDKEFFITYSSSTSCIKKNSVCWFKKESIKYINKCLGTNFMTLDLPRPYKVNIYYHNIDKDLQIVFCGIKKYFSKDLKIFCLDKFMSSITNEKV